MQSKSLNASCYIMPSYHKMGWQSSIFLCFKYDKARRNYYKHFPCQIASPLWSAKYLFPGRLIMFIFIYHSCYAKIQKRPLLQCCLSTSSPLPICCLLYRWDTLKGFQKHLHLGWNPVLLWNCLTAKRPRSPHR